MPDALATYEQLTGAVLDNEDTGLLQITPAQFANLESLFFHIGDVSLLPNCILFQSPTLCFLLPRPPSSSRPTLRSGPVRYVSHPSLVSPPRSTKAHRTYQQLNTLIGGTSDFVYLIVNDLGSLSGEGLDFIDGMTFLERFYYVFDIANSRVGFATTAFTDATTN